MATAITTLILSPSHITHSLQVRAYFCRWWCTSRSDTADYYILNCKMYCTHFGWIKFAKEKWSERERDGMWIGHLSCAHLAFTHIQKEIMLRKFSAIKSISYVFSLSLFVPVSSRTHPRSSAPLQAHQISCNSAPHSVVFFHCFVPSLVEPTISADIITITIKSRSTQKKAIER